MPLTPGSFRDTILVFFRERALSKACAFDQNHILPGKIKIPLSKDFCDRPVSHPRSMNVTLKAYSFDV